MRDRFIPKVHFSSLQSVLFFTLRKEGTTLHSAVTGLCRDRNVPYVSFSLSAVWFIIGLQMDLNKNSIKGSFTVSLSIYLCYILYSNASDCKRVKDDLCCWLLVFRWTVKTLEMLNSHNMCDT